MPDSPATDNATPERIDSPQYIRVLLDKMVSSPHLVNIATLTDQPAAVSTLLRVDGENREILLDKPYVTDPSAAFDLSTTDLVNLSGEMNGSSISFQAEFKEIMEEEGLSLYRLSFPREIFYLAKRSSHRVNTRNFDTNITFTSSSGYTFEAPLCDISNGGLRVMAGRNIIRGLTKGDEIFCKLDVDDGSCNRLKVSLHKPLKTDDPLTIEFGAIFVDPTVHQLNQISYYISGLERKSLRKHHSIPEPMPLNDIAGTVAEAKSD